VLKHNNSTVQDKAERKLNSSLVKFRNPIVSSICEIPKCNPADVALLYYTLEEMHRFSDEEDMYKEHKDTVELFILDTCEAIDTALCYYPITIFT